MRFTNCTTRKPLFHQQYESNESYGSWTCIYTITPSNDLRFTNCTTRNHCFTNRTSRTSRTERKMPLFGSYQFVYIGQPSRAVKKAYWFSDKQKSYLLAKFRIGQTTGRKLDVEVVASEMRHARGADCLQLFQSSEFLTASQIASYFSRLNAAAHQQDMDELDIQASEEETNFTSARDVVATASQIQHPITYDQFNLCSMAKGDTLKMLKLPMLQRVCEGLGLDVPQCPVRRKAPYMELLKDITQNCACQQ